MYTYPLTFNICLSTNLSNILCTDAISPGDDIIGTCMLTVDILLLLWLILIPNSSSTFSSPSGRPRLLNIKLRIELMEDRIWLMVVDRERSLCPILVEPSWCLL